MYKVDIRGQRPRPPPRPLRVAVTSAGSTGSATYQKPLGILDSESADHVPSLDRKKLPPDKKMLPLTMQKPLGILGSEAAAGILKLAREF